MSQSGNIRVGSGGGGGGSVETLSGDAGGPVGPNGSGNIGISDAVTTYVTGTPISNNLQVEVVSPTDTFLVGNGPKVASKNIGPLDDGELIIGVTGDSPVVASLTAGSNITITPGPGSITISASGGGGGGVVTIDGDSGSITGSTVTIYADQASLNCGQTVEFVNSGTISTLNLTDGSANTLLGLNSGNPSISGGSNTSLGQAALQIIQSGDSNVAIGVGALDSTSSGSFNIGIGQLAGDNFSGSESSNILLNSLGSSSDENTLRIGSATGTSSQQLNAAYIQGIYGNNQPVSGTIEFVTIDNTTGLLGVTTTASGSVTLNPDTSRGSPISGNTLAIQAFSDANFPNNCGSSVYFIGDTAATPQTMVLNVTDSNNNTLVGLRSGNGSITGTDNLGLGLQSLTSLTSGFQNVGIGVNSLQSMQTGGFNVAIGVSALQSSVADFYNTAIGTNALMSMNGSGNNTAIGPNCLSSSVTDENNTAIGFSVLQNCNGGISNVGIGVYALNHLTTGGDNIAMGYTAGYALLGGGQNIALGTGALGKSTSAGGAVAIGWASLANTITDQGNTAIGFSTLIDCNGGSNNTAIGFNAMVGVSTGNDNTAIGYNCLAVINTGGFNIGIGPNVGSNYSSDESSNILFNSPGVITESNTLRIGTSTGTGAAQLSQAFISGINGNTVSSPMMVVIDSSDQLGVASIPSGGFTWVDVTSGTQTIAGGFGYVTDNATQVTYTLPASPAFGDEFKVTGGASGSATAPWIIVTNAGQTINLGSTVASTSVASTLQYDSINCICVVAGASAVFVAQNSVGNLVLT